MYERLPNVATLPSEPRLPLEGDLASRERSGIEEAACAQTVEALSRALELRDYRRGSFAETKAHCDRVTHLGLRLTERVAPELAIEPSLAHGFRLHDIGMIGVSDTILRKRGALTPSERDEIYEHPLLGERIVAPISALAGVARDVVGGHHERWDGTGYPRRIGGDSIPLVARIFSIVDAFESLTHDQPYRDAFLQPVAIREIERQSGVQFDPELVRIFTELVAP